MTSRPTTILAAAVTTLLMVACGSGGSDGGGGSGGSDMLTCSGGTCMAELAQAVDALSTMAATMKADVAGACAAIATDLGATGVPDVGDPASLSDADVKLVCELAGAAAAQAQADSSYQVAFGGSRCWVDAEAQLACEQGAPPGGCNPGTIAERCPLGGLAGLCYGSCGGDCIGTDVPCEGACDGICHGQCSGSCLSSGPGGACAGICDATCVGTCDGACTMNAGAGVECIGLCEACEVELESPQCAYTLTPSACGLDSACLSACAIVGAAGVSCAMPAVDVAVAEGPGDPTYVATMKTNLPALRLVQVEFILGLMQELVDMWMSVDPAGLSAGCAIELQDRADESIAAASAFEASLSGALTVLSQVGG